MNTRACLIAGYLALTVPWAVSAQESPIQTESRQGNSIQVLVGTWRSAEGKLVRIFSPSPGVIVFQGRHDDWFGRLEPASGDRAARVRFVRKPKASEMDEAAPEWARRQVEGRLEWVLDLEFEDCPESKLRGHWYKGTVRWRPGQPGSAEVGERGEGVSIEYVLVSRSTGQTVASNLESTSAVPPTTPSRVEEARLAYLDAKGKFSVAAAAVQTAEERLKAHQAAFFTSLAKEESEFAAIKQRIADLESRIAEEQAALIALASDEEGNRLLVARLKELRQRWDILKDYAQYVRPTLLRAFSNQIVEAGNELAKASQARERQRKPIEDRLVELRRQLAAEYDKELASIETFVNSTKRAVGLQEMLSGALEVDLARQKLARTDDALGRAFEPYAKQLVESAPPFLRSVKISHAERSLYVAHWDRENAGEGEPDIPAMRARLSKLALDIADIQQRRDAGREHREILALLTTGYGPTMQRTALFAANAEMTKIMLNAVTESVFVVVEVALTGGAATAARKATELAQSATEGFTREALRRPIPAVSIVESRFQAMAQRIETIGNELQAELTKELIAEGMEAGAARTRAAEQVARLLKGESPAQFAQSILKEAQDQLVKKGLAQKILALPVETATKSLEAAGKKLRDALAQEYIAQGMEAAAAQARAAQRVARWADGGTPEYLAQNILKEAKEELAHRATVQWPRLAEQTPAEAAKIVNSVLDERVKKFAAAQRALRESLELEYTELFKAKGLDAAAARARAAQQVEQYLEPFETVFRRFMTEAEKKLAKEMEEIRRIGELESGGTTIGTALASKAGVKAVTPFLFGSSNDFGPSRIYADAGCDKEQSYYKIEASGTVLDEMAKQLGQDALEVVFARMIRAAAGGGLDVPRSFLDGFRAAVAKNAPTRWAAIKSGASAFSGKFPVNNMWQAIKPGPADLISLASIVTKQVVTYYSAEQKLKYEAEYAKADADWAVAYTQYRLAMCDEMKLWNEIQIARREQAAIRGLSAAPHPRIKTISTDAALGEQRQQLTVALEFSEPLNRAPIVSLGDAAVRLTPTDGDAGSARNWRGTVNASDLLTREGRAPLKVELPPEAAPFASIDSMPSTAAYLDSSTSALAWRDYDGGADLNHSLRVCPAR